jgi:hypothetical protein
MHKKNDNTATTPHNFEFSHSNILTVVLIVPPGGWLPFKRRKTFLQIGQVELFLNHFSIHFLQKSWPHGVLTQSLNSPKQIEQLSTIKDNQSLTIPSGSITYPSQE